MSTPPASLDSRSVIQGLDGHIAFRRAGEDLAAICGPGMMTGVELADFARGQTGEGWRLSDARHFPSGDSNPCPCPGDPTRVHYLLHREEE